MHAPERESLRLAFRPKRVRLLFIGEAPPASGRFFYSGNSGLYRAMREAFCSVDPTITYDGFLRAFQRAGCYLVDLCPQPVDDLQPHLRRARRQRHEKSLSRDIAQLRPLAIATLLRAIEGNVSRAILEAAWSGPVIHLPYPGRWSRHRRTFVEALGPTLRELLHK